MKTEDIVLKYLQSDKCREEKYLPKEFFSVTVVFFKLLESLENAEMDIRLGIVEAEIISFCTWNADNVFLESHICELKNLLKSDFTFEKLCRCEVIFKCMRNLYLEKYANNGVILLEVN
ncbi:hypothetical protein [Bacteroides sp. CACC 737]|jgi:hypothetical protein|uniref:hypothetical protein n=1 Tax=Bacteroides sp. CACC 737 TaxID=2755405 RepID=UPI0015EE597A|nr:hypothetical protein [Bacteroides sp. CACC 737]QMI80501.1 hypothetical protein H1A11_01005 [Bacteroides sp. CACC 737]